MQREAAREPCTDSAHPTGPAISIREHHIVSPATPLHTSLCDWEQKQLTENWQAMCCPPYLRKCASCHPGDSCSGSLQSFSEFQFSYGYVSLIRGSNNEVQCKTAIEPKYGLLGLWPPKPTRVSNRQWHETPAVARNTCLGRRRLSWPEWWPAWPGTRPQSFGYLRLGAAHNTVLPLDGSVSAKYCDWVRNLHVCISVHLSTLCSVPSRYPTPEEAVRIKRSAK